MKEFNPIIFDISDIDIRRVLYTITRDKHGSVDTVRMECPIFAQAWDAVDKWLQNNAPTIIKFSQAKIQGTRRAYDKNRNIVEIPVELETFKIDHLILAIIMIVHGQQTKRIQKICFNSVKENVDYVAYRANDYVEYQYRFLQLNGINQYDPKLSFISKSIDSSFAVCNYTKRIAKIPDSLLNGNTYYLGYHNLRKEFIAELSPICEQIKPLKEIITETKSYKHTVPNDENFRICGYCFRNIRLAPKSTDTIAYHGFQRENNYGYGMMVHSSCSGAMLPPLESSPKATLLLIEYCSSYLNNHSVATLDKQFEQLVLKKQEKEKALDAYVKNKTSQPHIDAYFRAVDKYDFSFRSLISTCQSLAEMEATFDLVHKMLSTHHPETVETAFIDFNKEKIKPMADHARILKQKAYEI